MTAPAKERLYKTDTRLKRTLRVSYPVGHDEELVLRTEQDWNKDVEASSVSEDGNTWTFQLEADQPFLYFKPALVRNGELYWSVGPNKLVLMQESDRRISYPSFFSGERGHFSELIEIPSKVLDRVHRIRIYLPPPHDENTQASYLGAFMQDGQNLFFPEEAFRGQEWHVDETTDTLTAMSATEGFIFVGIYSEDRMRDYTRPGYEPYAKSLAQEIVPEVQ